MPRWTNWVGNQSFVPEETVVATDEAGVQAAVELAAAQGRRIRTVGTGHSFTPIVETDILLDTSAMRGITGIDLPRQRVSAMPKTTIGDFGPPLWEQGLALANQGDIDTQAIAGAIATATHGSGLHHPNFSAVLTGARIIDGQGNLILINEEQNPDLLPALQTSIGLLGIMTEVSIAAVPAYELMARTDVMPFDAMVEQFRHDIESYRHFGLFWMPTDESARLYNLHDAGADDCVVKRYRELAPTDEPFDRRGRSYEIYPMVYDPNFHEVEYFLPLESAEEVLQGMRDLMRAWLPLSVYPLEIRVVARDQAWLSPNYQRDNLVVSISGQPGTDYWPYLRACDDLFADYGGRPHWGKIHFMTRDRVDELFPLYQEFVDIRRRLDPKGTFLNPHLAELFA